MMLHLSSARFDFSQKLCLCGGSQYPLLIPFTKRKRKGKVGARVSCSRSWSFERCVVPSDGRNPNSSSRIPSSSRKVAKTFAVTKFYNELDSEELALEASSQLGSNLTSFQEDPIVDKLRTQLGVIHPLPSPPLNRNIAGLFVFCFFVGVAFDKLWTAGTNNKFRAEEGRSSVGAWPQVPTSFSLFLEKDLQRKESVEWVNMVLGKLWKVYRGGIENWLIGLLQPVIDNLKKPDYVERVEIKQFSLGDEPLSVRNVERRTSRRVNDLQYQIGLRYTGGARMLLKLSLKFGIVPIIVPVGVRDFDIDGELWVKLRLIPTEPWVGSVSWAFVSLPKIKFKLSPFRLFNLMAIPVLSMFLTKLLTEDLPSLFVRPKKIVLDFQNGQAVGPVAYDFKSGDIQEGNNDYVGELSVTIVDAQKLSYTFYGKTDPYVVLNLGDQTIRSKKNSQTTVIGPPGEPIWNQDFHMLVTNPRKQKLFIQVNDSLGFADLNIGTGEVDLGSLKDTVPTDRVVALTRVWGIFGKRSSGKILLRLTYKAYVEDEEDEKNMVELKDTDISDDDESDEDVLHGAYGPQKQTFVDADQDSFMNVLTALLVSEEFLGIVSSEAVNTKTSTDDGSSAGSKVSQRVVNGNDKSLPADSDRGSTSGGSVLFWLAIVTSLSVLIALNISGSSIFNP